MFYIDTPDGERHGPFVNTADRQFSTHHADDGLVVMETEQRPFELQTDQGLVRTTQPSERQIAKYPPDSKIVYG